MHLSISPNLMHFLKQRKIAVISTFWLLVAFESADLKIMVYADPLALNRVFQHSLGDSVF
jgi:hypothetical protein